MILPDVNVLLQAMSPSMAEYDVASRWLTKALQGTELVALWEPTLVSVVRISTDPRVMKPPAKLEDALGYIETLRSAPAATSIAPSRTFWGVFERVMMESGVLGKGVSDVMLAALAIDHDCLFATFDGDFSRFPQLRLMKPTKE